MFRIPLFVDQTEFKALKAQHMHLQLQAQLVKHGDGWTRNQRCGLNGAAGEDTGEKGEVAAPGTSGTMLHTLEGEVQSLAAQLADAQVLTLSPFSMCIYVVLYHMPNSFVSRKPW